MYYAGSGKVIVRKRDGFVMGTAICLGSADDIKNYREREFTDEERAAFSEQEDGAEDDADSS